MFSFFEFKIIILKKIITHYSNPAPNQYFLFGQYDLM